MDDVVDLVEREKYIGKNQCIMSSWDPIGKRDVYDNLGDIVLLLYLHRREKYSLYKNKEYVID